MDVDRVFITRLALGLPTPVFAQPGERIEGLRLVELREMICKYRGEDIPIKAMPNKGSAAVVAVRLRTSLGAEFIVTVDDNGFIYGRARAAGEPARRKKKLRYDHARFLTVDETAAALGVSKLWLRVLADRGQITRQRFGRRVLYRRSEVERLAKRRAAEKQSTS